MKHHIVISIIIWKSYHIIDLVLPYYQMISSICYEKLYYIYRWYSTIWRIIVIIHSIPMILSISAIIIYIFNQQISICFSSTYLDCNHDNQIWFVIVWSSIIKYYLHFWFPSLLFYSHYSSKSLILSQIQCVYIILDTQ